MRIALVAENVSPLALHAQPAAGNDASRVISLAHALAALGHRVNVYARRDSGTLPESAILAPRVTVEYVTAGPRTRLDAARLLACLPEFGNHLAQRWRRNHPDLVHAHYWTAGLAALAGTRDLGVPVAQTFGSLGRTEQRHGMPGASDSRTRLEACIARSADVVLASSTDELAGLGRLGVPRAKVKVVPCGVDTGQFSPDGPAAKRGRRPRLIAAQPLTAATSLRVAVRALADIPDAELVIMGGPGRSELSKDKTLRELVRIARKHGVQDRLVCTGRVAPDGLPALLRSADLMVSTASYEPVGMTAIQAMACGTPVVTCAAGAERDAVVDKITGILAPAGDPAQLALRVRWLMANSLRLEAYGIAAADRAKSRYSWERIGRETLAGYGYSAPLEAASTRRVQPGPGALRETRQASGGARA